MITVCTIRLKVFVSDPDNLARDKKTDLLQDGLSLIQ
jgi:hypothetical protein